MRHFFRALAKWVRSSQMFGYKCKVHSEMGALIRSFCCNNEGHCCTTGVCERKHETGLTDVNTLLGYTV